MRSKSRGYRPPFEHPDRVAFRRLSWFVIMIAVLVLALWKWA